MSERARQFEAFREYATARESEALDALIAHGNDADAAEAIGSTLKNFRVLLHKLKKRAAKRGWAPEQGLSKPTPPGFHIGRTNTLYGANGELKLQWVSNELDREERITRLLDVLPELLEPFRGHVDPSAGPEFVEDDWLTVYPMGDPHLGMFAWGEESGDDFDLNIAERNLTKAFDQLVDVSRPSGLGLLISVGDFFHADDSTNRTARSGHALDVDTRYAKILRVAVRAMRYNIDRALTKHKQVRVILEVGNHDDHLSLVLAMALSLLYENEPRVSIDTSPAAYHYFRFGRVLIGTTHGDQCKLEKLPMIMAHDRQEDWGETRHRFWFTGHVHHDSRKDLMGCTVETFRTLAAKDAWHARAGYRSQRSMVSIEIHKEHGEKRRCQVGIEELERAAA